ncbi:hypothetical protein BH23VER1_BH23VER1_23830 [soil metagenome]
MTRYPGSSRPLATAVALAALGCATVIPSHAQDDDEIPRAIPVNPEESPRAIPVNPPTTPDTPEAPADAPPPPAADEAPKATGPEGDLFTYANLVFSNNQYELAVRQYSKYIESYPNGINAQEAHYRLGESHLNLQQAAAAQKTFTELLDRFKTGDFRGFAAYRVGMLEYARRNYAAAIPYLRIATAEAKKADVRTKAVYYHARSLQLSGELDASLPLFEKVAESSDRNPFWQNSLIAAARIRASRGQEDAALAHYQKLVGYNAATPEALGEALVQSGLILTGQGNDELATDAFEAVFDLDEKAREWKPLARYGLIDSHYKSKRYQEAIDTYTKTNDYILPDDTRPKMLLMVGNSHRYLKQYARAVDIYLVVEQYYGDRPEGQEAAYNKLICFYNNNDPNLPRFVDAFMRKSDYSGPLVDQALLLKAEHLRTKADHSGAADAYSKINLDNIPESLRATTVYRHGFAQAESGELTDAISTFTRFLENYPDDRFTPHTLAKRALCFKQLEDNSKALGDFERIIAEFPETQPAELAYQQAALLHGLLNQNAAMIETFEAMLEKYPDSIAAAEATFWIGRGHYKEGQFEEAIRYLQKASEMDRDEYYERAASDIILAAFYLQDVERLTEAINNYRKENPNAFVPPQILGWLGLKKFEAGDFTSSEKFLMLASNPEDPNTTRAEVWNYLGKARAKQERFEQAVPAFQNYVATVKSPAERGRALVDLGRAQLGAKQFEDATKSAEEGLELQKEGRVNAELWILLGDIAMAEGDYEDAVAKFVVPAQLFEDPQITPEALAKSIKALEQLGEEAKAEELRKQLRENYPSYKSTPS